MEINNHDKYYNELHAKSYECLINLAEMSEEDRQAPDHCDVAMRSMAKIFKYGSCKDMAEGLKHYVDFLQSKNEIAENE